MKGVGSGMKFRKQSHRLSEADGWPVEVGSAIRDYISVHHVTSVKRKTVPQLPFFILVNKASEGKNLAVSLTSGQMEELRDAISAALDKDMREACR